MSLDYRIYTMPLTSATAGGRKCSTTSWLSNDVCGRLKIADEFLRRPEKSKIGEALSRTGKYIGGSTIIHTGNYGGPSRDATASDTPTSPLAVPRGGGVATDLTEHRKSINATLKRRRQARKSAKRGVELRKWRIKVADLKADILNLEGCLENSLSQFDEIHPNVQELKNKLTMQQNRLKRYMKKLRRWLSADIESSRARLENDKHTENGTDPDIDAK